MDVALGVSDNIAFKKGDDESVVDEEDVAIADFKPKMALKGEIDDTNITYSDKSDELADEFYG